MAPLEFVLSLCLGIGLAAACGFRVFVPMLGMCIAALSGHLQLASGFEWIGSWPALAVFLAATILEIGAYYVPWLDNLLDTIATPAAVVAGTILVAATLGMGNETAIVEISPLLRWTLAAIAGGAVAGAIQFATVSLRGSSTLTTGGFANFLVSTGELFFSVLTTLLALVLPIVGFALAVAVSSYLVHRRFRKAPPPKIVPAKEPAAV